MQNGPEQNGPEQNCSEQNVTHVLRAAAAGDKDAASALLPLVYDELRRLARIKMSNTPPGQTLQATALVHEAYLRVLGDEDPGWEGRGHFFGAAARAMRNILVDQARRKASLKRGGDRRREALDDATPVVEPPTENVLALNEALQRLEADDPRKGSIVNLRYFAGLSIEETAAVLELSVGTVKREWRYAKHWLFTQIAEDPGGPSHGCADE
jgi:RNA polymerase sigma factor (TIGR02999 family)